MHDQKNCERYCEAMNSSSLSINWHKNPGRKNYMVLHPRGGEPPFQFLQILWEAAPVVTQHASKQARCSAH